MRLIGNLFLPIPSEVVLPLVGFLSALVASTLGSLIGALVLYGLRRWAGPPVLRHHKWLRVSAKGPDRAEG